jgi:orotidine-5'-phosphate decarboxylase
MKAAIIATLILAVPTSIALSAPAEAKRFRFPGGSSKPPVHAAKAAEKPGATRGGATILIVPGIGSAQAATRPEEAERRHQPDVASRQAEEAARKEEARKAEAAYRASLPPRHEIPRLGMLSAHESKPALPGFTTLN